MYHRCGVFWIASRKLVTGTAATNARREILLSLKAFEFFQPDMSYECEPRRTWS